MSVLEKLQVLSADFKPKSKPLNKFVWKVGDVKIIKTPKPEDLKLTWKLGDVKIVKSSSKLDDFKHKTDNLHKKLSEEAMEHFNKITKNKPQLSPEELDKYNKIRRGNNLPDEYSHINAIKHYNSGETNMNKNYRLDKKIPKHEQTIIKTLKTITNNPTKHNFYAHRLMDKKLHEKVKEGDVIQDKGFTSTTIKNDYQHMRKIRNAVLEVSPKHTIDIHHYKIHVPTGTKGHYISVHDKYLQVKNEHEFLLHPGTKFKVGKTEHDPELGHTVTHLHIHSQED